MNLPIKDMHVTVMTVGGAQGDNGSFDIHIFNDGAGAYAEINLTDFKADPDEVIAFAAWVKKLCDDMDSGKGGGVRIWIA